MTSHVLESLLTQQPLKSLQKENYAQLTYQKHIVFFHVAENEHVFFTGNSGDLQVNQKGQLPFGDSLLDLPWDAKHQGVVFKQKIRLKGDVTGFQFYGDKQFGFGVYQGAQQELEVEHINEEITQELELAKQEALEASRVKSQFLATMSHEIRTPLNGIIGYLDIIKDTEMTFEQREYFKTIEVCSNSLLALINDILDLSKIEANEIELEHEPFDLNGLIIEANKIIQSRIIDKNIFLTVNMPQCTSYTVGDSFRLKQIIVNFLGNAAKFTHKGFVRSGFEILDNGKLRFFIEDSGIGMSEEQMVKLFEPFKQADKSITRKYGGTGLGMTISKNLIELMHGEVKVTSKIKEGTRIDFQIPYEHGNRTTLQKYPLIPAKVCLDAKINEVSPEVYEILKLYSENVEICDSLDSLASLSCKEIILLDYEMMLKYNSEDKKKFEELLDKNVKKDVLIYIVIQYASPVVLHNLKKYNIDHHLQWPLWHHNLRDVLKGNKARSVVKSGRHKVYSTKKLNVLVAEDNMINQKLIVNILKSVGTDIELAGDGQQALEMVRLEDFDIILMDMQMPRMDGITATKEIRKFNKDVPIIALTANAYSSDKEACLEAGMNDFLAKPIKKQDILETLSKFSKDTFVHGLPELSRVLLVEDEPTVLKIVGKHFNHSFPQIALETATNGMEACAKLGGYLPDLIITDITMPKMDGIELVKFVKTNERFKHIHMVLYTSIKLSEETQEEVNDLGVKKVFHKYESVETVMQYIRENFKV